MTKKRILSGMRPTGPLHIGHLVGALANWIDLQDEFECYYMVADWHALMSEYANPVDIPKNSTDNVTDWLACGIDPEKSTIFVQSDVPEHTELHVILSCITPIPWLERVPTYKEQMQEVKDKDLTNYAFLGYPCLQAADILIYKAGVVPVGEDQVAHLELTREITRRFNSMYGEVFPEPKPRLTKTARLLGLDRRKMSKSYGNAIEIGESPEETRKKIMTMFTDPQRQRRSDPGRPEICNVHDYFKVFAPDRADAVAEGCRNAEIGCVDCKKEIAERLNQYLQPIRARRSDLAAHPDKIEDILSEGCKKARRIAAATLDEARQAMGIGRSRVTVD
ncbi:MAG: tryptophan--tRNA ligase [Planctomycetes bacterium]|nr:tryptophan--tRNA ligase [Planctomycetota bacterium]